MAKLSITAIKKEIRTSKAYAIAQAKRSFDKAQENMAAISMDLSALKTIIGRSKTSYVSAYVSDGVLRSCITITTDSLKKDKNLVGVLSRAADLCEGGESSDYVSEYLTERTFRFHLPFGGQLSVEARVKDDSATCRKVQVGVKTEEVPVFEIQCN